VDLYNGRIGRKLNHLKRTYSDEIEVGRGGFRAADGEWPGSAAFPLDFCNGLGTADIFVCFPRIVDRESVTHFS
jgi:hypothetical protein